MGSITNLFWNRQEGRLRAGWRVVAFFIGSFAFAEVLLGLRGTLLTRLFPVVAYRGAVEAGVYFLLVGILLWLVGRRLDRRRIADFGFHLNRAWWFDLGFGLALGTLLLLGIFLLELAMGWVKGAGGPATPPRQPLWSGSGGPFLARLCRVRQRRITVRGAPSEKSAGR